ncbi:MAG: M55 family metallopeptidase [Gemmatimonadales bacterium]
MTSLTRTFVGVLAALHLWVGVSSAQQKLKVYISADMEGVAGVVTAAQAGGSDYEWARPLLMGEVNAAIAAAFEAGASEVVVNDAHGSHTNLRADQLDPRAQLITGRSKPFGMIEGLDASFDAVIFIGYHGHAAQVNAVMGHTYSHALRHVWINGTEVGEYGTAGMVAGHHRVPVVFVSGDQAFAEVAREFFPGVEALAVKEGLGFMGAKTMSPSAARERIAAGVKSALNRRKAIAPISITTPVVLEIELAMISHADAAMFVPGMERVNGVRVRYRAPDALVAYRVSRLIMMLARD